MNNLLIIAVCRRWKLVRTQPSQPLECDWNVAPRTDVPAHDKSGRENQRTLRMKKTATRMSHQMNRTCGAHSWSCLVVVTLVRSSSDLGDTVSSSFPRLAYSARATRVGEHIHVVTWDNLDVRDMDDAILWGLWAASPSDGKGINYHEAFDLGYALSRTNCWVIRRSMSVDFLWGVDALRRKPRGSVWLPSFVWHSPLQTCISRKWSVLN